MPARFLASWTMARSVPLGILSAVLCVAVSAQRPPSNPPSGPPSGTTPNIQQLTDTTSAVYIGVRDIHGTPIDVTALVRLYSKVTNYDASSYTSGSSPAHFTGVPQGEYLVEVTCPGYRKSAEPYSMLMNHTSMPLYIYLLPDSEDGKSGANPHAVVLTPQLRGEVEKGLEALRKKQYEAAQKIFSKAAHKASGNPDIAYFLGLAELSLQRTDLARQDFQHAISIDPTHEMALVSLGELQLQSGARADAITSFEKAAALPRAGWKAHYGLACAYFQVNRFADAETEATTAVRLAKDKSAAASLLLGEIQYAGGNRQGAKRTWQSILGSFPTDPVVPETKHMLERAGNNSPGTGSANNSESPSSASPGDTADLPLPLSPDLALLTIADRPWAPPDIDSTVYTVAAGITCNSEPILDGALDRLKGEMADFEKFTATEHIEHQEINRYGYPGTMKARDFSYIVFVYPFGKDSFYLEEYRNGGTELSNFPTSIARLASTVWAFLCFNPFIAHVSITLARDLPIYAAKPHGKYGSKKSVMPRGAAFAYGIATAGPTRNR